MMSSLRQTAAHHVADGQKHDIEPCPVGAEVVLMRVGGTDEERRDQHADDSHDVNDGYLHGGRTNRVPARAVEVPPRGFEPLALQQKYKLSGADTSAAH